MELVIDYSRNGITRNSGVKTKSLCVKCAESGCAKRHAPCMIISIFLFIEGKTKLPKEFDVKDSKNNSECNKRFSLLKSSKHVCYEMTKGKDKLSAKVEVLSLKG